MPELEVVNDFVVLSLAREAVSEGGVELSRDAEAVKEGLRWGDLGSFPVLSIEKDSLCMSTLLL